MHNLEYQVIDTLLDCGRKVEHPEENPCENGESVQTPHRKGQRSNYVQLWIDPYGSFPKLLYKFTKRCRYMQNMQNMQSISATFKQLCLGSWFFILTHYTVSFCWQKGGGWWELWTDSLTLALWLWICSGEPRECPEAAPTKCSPHVS